MTIIEDILKKRFGYDQFRDQQREIIEETISGKDTLVLMPTGGGKSLCYQIPALAMEGLTLVISPLISLMKDQVEALQSNGIPSKFVNSSITAIEEQLIIEEATSGKLKLLYISPEKLIASKDQWITELPLSLVAIDEAHCVSMWGHDFRPEYTMLKTFREAWSNTPFIALTATADKTTRKDIITQIGLVQPRVFVSSFDRKNLSLTVRSNVPKKKKIGEIQEFIFNRPNESGIIYCLSRKGTEEMASELSNIGISAVAYHAGLSSDERNQIQDDFINDRKLVICATIAFGMGIDKSNVRWVIHNNLPKNIEGYYQEIGRAGRDGLESDTVLYYNLRDLMVLKQFAENGAKSEVYLDKLNRMLNYAQATSCRRRILLSYFSEHVENDCGNCDVCLNPPQFIDGTVIAQKALSASYRTEQKVGTIMLINILRGSGNQDILKNGYHLLKTYGAGAEISFKDWQHYLTQMVNLGVFEIAYDEAFTLKITPFGERILYGKASLDLTNPLVQEKTQKKSQKKKKLTPNQELFELLRSKRMEIAREQNVPAYVIFHDATLEQIASEQPKNELDLLTISGISEVKAERYGTAFIKVVEKFKQSKRSTYDISFELYQEGFPIEEIAEQRGLKIQTVVSHLCKKYLEGADIELRSLIDKEDLEVIEKLYPKLEKSMQLGPYFQELDGSMPYDKIRIALTIIERSNRIKDRQD